MVVDCFVVNIIFNSFVFVLKKIQKNNTKSSIGLFTFEITLPTPWSLLYYFAVIAET
tara:strand:- start:708 stop:878 length:171 start_codon:yes stop_codon:yes gene_type:complete